MAIGSGRGAWALLLAAALLGGCSLAPAGPPRRLVLGLAEALPDAEAQEGDWIELPPLPMGLAGQTLRLLGPAGEALPNVALRLVDASGELALPLGSTNAAGQAQLPMQPDLDPLLLWRIETVGAPGGPRAAWLPFPRRQLMEAPALELDAAGALVAQALAPRWVAWGRLSHEAQGPFAEWVAQDVLALLAQLRPALAQLSSEERARLGAAMQDGGDLGADGGLRRVVPEGGPIAQALATLGDRLANALLHAALDGGPTLPMAAQLARSLGGAKAPAVGDAVLDEVSETETRAFPPSGSGGGGGAAGPAPVATEPAGKAGVSLGFLPKPGLVGAPALPEGASTSGALPALTSGVAP